MAEHRSPKPGVAGSIPVSPATATSTAGACKILLTGHPGSGKTIFAEQLIFGNASDDRPIIYFTTLSEPLAKTRVSPP